MALVYFESEVYVCKRYVRTGYLGQDAWSSESIHNIYNDNRKLATSYYINTMQMGLFREGIT